MNSQLNTTSRSHAGPHLGMLTQDLPLTTALYYLSYAFGDPGFSIPMGLLIAGVCIPAAVHKLLPKWLVVFGLLLAVAGEPHYAP